MRTRLSIYVLLLLAVSGQFGCDAETTSEAEVTLRARADSLAHASIIVDGHIDVPYRLTGFHEDVSQETFGGDFDYPRAVEGGLDAPFMSIYIPAEFQETGGGAERADSLIDLVNGLIDASPDEFAHAHSVADVRANFEAGLMSLPMGMENGAPVGEDLSLLQHFYDRGIRYITLTHSRVNQLSDSSYDTTRVHGGLSEFGMEVVDEMNRLGMIVDVSHLSDSAFYDVMDRSAAPVMATHSSARYFTPGWERNMSDEMIRRLAENGGVIMINFGSSFLRGEYDAEGDSIQEALREQMREEGFEEGSAEAVRWFEEQRKANLLGSVDDVVAHINHVVDLVGIEYVGLGSDYDGVFALPEGLQDVSTYPNLVYHLLEDGYSDEEIRLILGENALRVWSAVERTAEGGA